MALAKSKRLVDSGSIVVGSKGMAYSPNDYGSNVVFSTGKTANSSTKPETMPSNNGDDLGQKKEWVEAIKAGKPETGRLQLRLRRPADVRLPAR